jgi:hypothetical protein
MKNYSIKLSRFEALSLLPKTGLCTVYLMTVNRSGDVREDRRRVSPEVLVDRYLTETPSYQLASLELKREYRDVKDFGLTIWVGGRTYLKPSSQRVKRFLRLTGEAKPLGSWKYDEKEIRAQLRGYKHP